MIDFALTLYCSWLSVQFTSEWRCINFGRFVDFNGTPMRSETYLKLTLMCMKIVYLMSLNGQGEMSSAINVGRNENFSLPLEDGQNTTALK